MANILFCFLVSLLFASVLSKPLTAKPVTGLPGSSSIKDTSYAGYVTVDAATDSNLFYWFFESRSNPATDPVVLWMTGGPGCSSELAIVFENGAFNITKDLTLESNPYSWNSVANVLYIDQPYGTGFSYSRGSTVRNETQMADDMYIFLTLWFQEWSQYANNDFFITGESFGGHYVPALAVRVLQGPNSFNLKGIAIGNGWVDPEIQYGSYGPFAYQNKLISETTYAKINRTYATCESLLEKGQYNTANLICPQLMDDVLEEAGNINIYNIDLPCVGGELCYDFTSQTKYMNLAATKAALGVTQSWTTCAPTQITSTDIISSYRQDIPIVLAKGVPVVAYSGMLDLICNYVGGEFWTYSMPWPHQAAFDAAPFSPWVINGKTVGYTRSSNNFTFVEVLQAGHMVPHDQPAVALALLQRFLQHQF